MACSGRANQRCLYQSGCRRAADAGRYASSLRNLKFMNMRRTFLGMLLSLIGVLSFLPPRSFAQQSLVPQGGCVALDKNSPPLFISFESRDDKVWAGDKYEKGVLLRLNNNSTCVISLTAPPGVIRDIPPNFGIKNGKLVRLPDIRIGSVRNGEKVGLYYLMKYPGKASLVLEGDFHVRDTIYLKGGDHIFFSVPLKNFRRHGQLLVPFNYDWDSDNAAYIIVETNGSKQGYEVVEHYLTFVPERLPDGILK
jgi:hypothetical protein